MNETKGLSRLGKIINYLGGLESATRDQIEDFLEKTVYKVSRPTLSRDLQSLVKSKQLEIVGGGGRWIKYKLAKTHPLLKPINIQAYFQEQSDYRIGVQKEFNEDVFGLLSGIFAQKEIIDLNKIYKPLGSVPNKRELERFLIELAWKSSRIEGNTYTLLETEILIKSRQEAAGHSKFEATMILNHKFAFEQILGSLPEFKKLQFSDILQLHNALVTGLEVETGIRKIKVGISGSVYIPLDNEWQLRENLEKIIDFVNKTEFILEKALIITAMVAYLQPFADGNKRTSRMLANAVLMAYGWYPLSYRSVDEGEYKKAMIIFYETNNLLPLKQIVVDQYRFALNTYFL